MTFDSSRGNPEHCSASWGPRPMKSPIRSRTAACVAFHEATEAVAIALYLTALMGSDPRVRSVRVGHCAVLIDVATARRTGRTVACWSNFRSRYANSLLRSTRSSIRPSSAGVPVEPLPATVASAPRRME